MDNAEISPDNSQYELYDLICRGDTEAVAAYSFQEALCNMADKRTLSRDKLRNLACHFLLCASTIAAACMDSGMGQTEAYTLADIYIIKADECKTADGIYALYKDLCADFAERMHEIRKEAVISLHVRKCIDYIYENLGSDLSVNSLAEKAGLHPAYLSKLFLQETGIRLKRFVKEARVDTAQNLLRYTDLPYPVISTSLGFSTQSAFIAVFREITGTTPKTYRETNYVLHK